MALEKPEDAIFIIPLRLDECFVPRSIKHLQYVDYFSISNRKESYELLKTAIEIRARSIGVNVDDTMIKIDSIKSKECMGKF